MLRQWLYCFCLLSAVAVGSVYGQQVGSQLAGRSNDWIQLSGPSGNNPEENGMELLPPALENPIRVSSAIFTDLGARTSSGECYPIMPTGFEPAESRYPLRIWHVPYGVWIQIKTDTDLVTYHHTDPTGLAYVVTPIANSIDQEISLRFARSNSDFMDARKYLAAQVWLAANKSVDFDFVRAGGNTRYGNLVQTSLLVDLPEPAEQLADRLPVAASSSHVSSTFSGRKNRTATVDDSDIETLSRLVRCRDLPATTFSGQLAFEGTANASFPDISIKEVSPVRLCEVAISDEAESCFKTEWILTGKVQVDAGSSRFRQREDSCRLKIPVKTVRLSIPDDADRKLFVVAEDLATLKQSLGQSGIVDASDQPLSDYLARLKTGTEITLRLSQVKLQLGTVKLADTCTEDVSEIQIHFVRR